MLSGVIIMRVVNDLLVILCFFFKQKTAYEMRISDWSSDVCSSDLFRREPGGVAPGAADPAGDDAVVRRQLARRALEPRCPGSDLCGGHGHLRAAALVRGLPGRAPGRALRHGPAQPGPRATDPREAGCAGERDLRGTPQRPDLKHRDHRE